MSPLINVNDSSNPNIVGSHKPIIGILAQEAHSVRHLYPNEIVHSYIAASYVKFVESAGGRVLPIRIGQNREYYKNIVDKTNGLMLPGGAALFGTNSGFSEAGQYLYDIALECNQNNDFYPIWAICLGMELMIQTSLSGKEIRSQCNSRKKSLPLILKPDINTSRLFCNVPDTILQILRSENVTANSHRYCFTEKTFQKYNLLQEWRVLSTNYDDNGLEFISSYEHTTLPFYGVQFHPEKNAFEFEPHYEHGGNAVIAAQYFGNFFIDECRKNKHEIDEQLRDELIYKYVPRYSGSIGSIYEQIYLFDE
ncbi:gamma-glutamyl hydrolase-like [Atheta coriaria]|uniref:gamma-glutamyl hydrolase-like n=1 Tax=Dalotia coriaria TaxID=877792 RepID=UPI0031F454D6